MSDGELVFLSLGANLGNRREQIEAAVTMLRESEVIDITARSAFYQTEPQDRTDQPWFYNLVIAGASRVPPLHLLKVLQGIEQKLGRLRGPNEIWRGPRSIDIDILLYGTLVLSGPELTIPHPRLLNRRFVLEPLCEIDPDGVDPRTGRPFRSFLQSVKQQLVVRIPEDASNLRR